jgi:hypothetical protein
MIHPEIYQLFAKLNSINNGRHHMGVRHVAHIRVSARTETITIVFDTLTVVEIFIIGPPARIPYCFHTAATCTTPADARTSANRKPARQHRIEFRTAGMSYSTRVDAVIEVSTQHCTSSIVRASPSVFSARASHSKVDPLISFDPRTTKVPADPDIPNIGFSLVHGVSQRQAHHAGQRSLIIDANHRRPPSFAIPSAPANLTGPRRSSGRRRSGGIACSARDTTHRRHALQPAVALQLLVRMRAFPRLLCFPPDKIF